MNGNSAWRFQLAPGLSSCRLLNGMGPVSGAHGRIAPTAVIRRRFDYADAGFTTGGGVRARPTVALGTVGMSTVGE